MSYHPTRENKARLLGALAVVFFAYGPLRAQGKTMDSGLCVRATQQVERNLHIPDGFLSAMSRVEAGKKGDNEIVSGWPWTVNAAGVGHQYGSKQEAVTAVEEFQRQGIRSIDVGCMQVNLMHHPDAFPDLNSAFDPYANSAYAGRFLTQLFDKTGSWPRAAAAYHSQTPGVGEPYQWKVLEAWSIPQDGRGSRDGNSPHEGHTHSNSPSMVAANQNNLSSSARPVSTFRPFRPFSGNQGGISPSPRHTDKYSSGRTLASYRAYPTHMVSIAPRPQIY